MKTVRLSITLAVLICGGGAAFAQSNVYSFNVVGYVNTAFRIGDNLFGNPLQSATNTLSNLFPAAPEGTTVSLWNSAGNTYTPVSTFASGAWDIDFTLNPGTGAKLHTTLLFTNTFVGTVLAPNGVVWDGNAVNLPLPFAGPNGLHLLSSKFPAVLSETNGPSAFHYILGRGPQEGEQFITLDPTTQLYHTTTFTSGAWDNGNPLLPVGQAAFFNVGPVAASVPEPTVAGVVIAGVCLARVISRRR